VHQTRSIKGIELWPSVLAVSSGPTIHSSLADNWICPAKLEDRISSTSVAPDSTIAFQFFRAAPDEWSRKSKKKYKKYLEHLIVENSVVRQSTPVSVDKNKRSNMFMNKKAQRF